MTAAFSRVSDADLRELAAALKSRRVSAPYSELQVNRVLSPKLAPDVTASLHELATLGFDEQQIATTLDPKQACLSEKFRYNLRKFKNLRCFLRRKL